MISLGVLVIAAFSEPRPSRSSSLKLTSSLDLRHTAYSVVLVPEHTQSECQRRSQFSIFKIDLALVGLFFALVLHSV